MRDVAIIGIGMTDFGELWNDSLRDLFVKAALDAINDAGVDHVDSLVAGCMSPGLFAGQEHIGSLLADYLGQGPIAATRVESACASGGLALRVGLMEVASGMNDVVLCGGVEKMTDVSGAQATYALATAADQDYEAFHGVTFPGLYAMIATAHMHKYGTKREDLAQVAVKNHDNGLLNPHAQYHMKVTVEQVINSVKVADPLNILDCSPITDGAAAVIICPLEMAKKMKKKPIVKIAASAHATDTIALHQRDDITWLNSTAVAAAKAYKMAGVKPQDIDFAEVHDCFTIAEICVLEAMGIVKKGEGGKATREGLTARDGKFPVNPSGGLKSKGHPVGATGIAQIHEIVTQLRGDAGKRQLKKARRALAQNMGGSGGSAVVHILEVL
ncbi:MAG: thiolase domain-containing protein [Acidobacteria bacterium]|jgi:acetyl-CoA C-acetyltransferase|nr:thiolase domain-containing protein [Acidobacteriota bacterium]